MAYPEYNSYIDILLASMTAIVWIMHLCMLMAGTVCVYICRKVREEGGGDIHISRSSSLPM